MTTTALPGTDPSDLPITVRAVPGTFDTEIHAIHHAPGPIGFDTAEALARQLRRTHGAQLLRAVVFGDIVGPLPVHDDRWVWVRPTHGRPSGTSVELLALARDAEDITEVHRLSSGASLVAQRLPDGSRTLRTVHCLPLPAGIGIHAQLTHALKAVEKVLEQAGMAPSDIDRTWFFVSNIGAAYAALNKARDEAFDRWGIQRYPASTGIGAVLAPGAAVSLVVEASRHEAIAGGKRLTVLDTPLQTAPSSYGPRFVRGNTVRVAGRRTVNVSGISHIDPEGRSILSDDPAVGVDYAMRSLQSLLAAGGVAPQDICSSYVYCRDAAVEKVFNAYLAARGLTFPYLATHVPMCRPELDFEIEAKAVLSEPAGANPGTGL